MSSGGEQVKPKPDNQGSETAKGASRHASQRKSAEPKTAMAEDESAVPEAAQEAPPRPATTDGTPAKSGPARKSKEPSAPATIGSGKLGSMKKEDFPTSGPNNKPRVQQPPPAGKDDKDNKIPTAGDPKSPSAKRQDDKMKMDKRGELDAKLKKINLEILKKECYNDIPDLASKLEKFKDKFMVYDEDMTGDLNQNNVKMMMEKLGQPKTHLELKKMIAEVDSTKSGIITYLDFMTMVLGKQNSVLKKILMYEELAKGADKAPKSKEPPPKKSLEDHGIRKV